MQPEALKTELLDRGYRLENALGAGGFGEVHRAVRLLDGRVVAVKIMHSRGRHGSRQVQVLRKRFEREAEVLSRLDHAGCVRLFDFGALSDGTLFMVQAWCSLRIASMRASLRCRSSRNASSAFTRASSATFTWCL